MNKIFSRMQNLESSKKFKSAKNSRALEGCLYFWALIVIVEPILG